MTGRTARRRPAGRTLAIVVAWFVVALLVPAIAAATLSDGRAATATYAAKSCFNRATVQSGTTTSTLDGVKTVNLTTSVTLSHAFLIFTVRSSGDRPVNSEVGGRIANTSQIEFVRDTDEASPITISIQWYVVEYPCGVNVQRGTVAPSAATTNVTISAVASTAAAFVTYSKTANPGDVIWSSNDYLIGELTSTTNLQFRMDSADSTHTIYWQVVEFTDTSLATVQRGTTSLTGVATSTTATISSVDTTKTFVLVGTRASPATDDLASTMVRARLTNATTLTFDRSASGDDVTEIAYQVVQLNDGSTVQHGTSSFAAAASTATAALSTVNLARTTAMASVQIGPGQSTGRSGYATTDVVGNAAATMALTTTQLTLTRSFTSASADIAWFVVSWGRP